MNVSKKARSGNYHAYLLRLWKEGEAQEWRATLEDVHSDTRQGFATLEALFEHVRQLTGAARAPGDNPILFKGDKR